MLRFEAMEPGLPTTLATSETPADGLAPTRLIAGYAVAAGATIIISLLAWQSIAQVAENQRRVEHAVDVVQQLGAVLADVTDAETGQRGYLITGEASYLDPYRLGVSRLESDLAHLEALTRGESNEAQVRALLEVLNEKVGELNETVQLRRTGRSDEAISRVRQGRGALLMDRARASVAEIRQAELGRLGDRVLASNRAMHRSVAIVVAGGLVLLALIVLAAQTSLRDSSRREWRAHFLSRVLELTSELSRAIDWDAAVRVVVEETARAVEVSRVSLLQLSDDGRELKVVATRGLPEETVKGRERVRTDDDRPSAEAARTQQALFFPSPQLLRQRYPSFAEELPQIGVEASAFLPLVVEGKTLGVLVVLYEHVQLFDGEQRGLLLLLAQNSAQALARARLYDSEQRARKKAESEAQKAEFLLRATEVLSSSLDYESTLEALARLAVPGIADWCSVDMVGEDGELKRLVVAHSDPAKVALAHEWQKKWPHKPTDPTGIYAIVRSGNPEVVQVTEAMIDAVPDPELRRIVRELGLSASIGVALSARGQVLGVLTLVSEGMQRRLGPEDLPFAQELARRAALAVDNARLYRISQQAIRLRDEFLSVASHELRTPLTPLTLRLDVMKRELEKIAPGPPADRVREGLQSAFRQLRRLTQLIEGLLDVSRISANGLQLEVSHVNASQILREAISRMEPEAQRVGSTLTASVEDGIEGDWDPMRLDQVITNLVSNAIKYGAGKPIEARLARVGGEAVFTVRDHGIGIRQDALDRIFGRFERAVSDRHYGGLGLGLYITRQILTAMGGSISVKSALGEGSLFTVRLPLEAAKTAASSDETPAETLHS